MRSNIRKIFLFFFFLILCLDTLFLLALFQDFSSLRIPIVPACTAISALIFIAGFRVSASLFLADNKPGFFSKFYVFTGFFLAFYVPKIFYIVFFLLEMLIKLPAFLIFRAFGGGMDFSKFFCDGPLDPISMIILPLSVLSFLAVIMGMLTGRFRYRTRWQEVFSEDLPESFEGLTLVHISDLHLGSMYGKQEKFKKAVEMINRENPDLVLFTGDLVNNLAAEVNGWSGILSEIRAGSGKYSVLGNHDYGEYYNWDSRGAREENMRELAEAHRESGFEMLLNRSVFLERGKERIYIAGVENWGLPPFKPYGDLQKTLENIPCGAFTILLSHDPSHWDAEVLPDSAVQLTLSGHTHGMQFGIRTGKIRWSPVQWKYPRWIGMYQEGGRYLHVNPGLGYIGYAGRIWIPPEISVITLKRRPGS